MEPDVIGEKASYPQEIKDRAVKMRRAKVSLKTISQELAVPIPTIHGWWQDHCRKIGEIPKERDDRDDHREKWLKDRLENAHYWDNPNVMVLGDPPFHRSALAQKLRETQTHEDL